MKGEIIFLSFEILGNVFPQFHFSKVQSFLWKVKVKLKKIILAWSKKFNSQKIMAGKEVCLWNDFST